MKFNNLLICTLLSAGMMGCGGSQNLDATTAPQSVQRMLSGGAQRSVQADAQPNATVSIAGYRDNFTVVKDQRTNMVTVTSKIDNSVTTYENPSLIKFVDKWVSFDIDGPAGQVYRLYQAAFNRKPDMPGLGFWIYHNANGMSITDISSNFIASDEFKSMYGATPSDSAFVDSLYQNVLHRAGETAGVEWWQGILKQGTDRRYVLFGFADSAENKGNLSQDVQNGFDYVPFNQGGPIIPQASSYLNAKNIGISPITLPSWSGENPVKFNASGETILNAFGFADFFQDGTLSMVAFTNNFVPNGNPDYGRTPGYVYFYKKDATGKWVDHTADILKDQSGCITPRKVVIADFNGDGKPDVFAACHGTDLYPLPPGYSYGEVPRILMSQSDGSYKNLPAPINCYCHGAAAAVMNSQGYADIVVTDPNVHLQPFMLINNKDGTFTPDYAKMPAAAAPVVINGKAYGKSIWSVELIDFDKTGKFDLWLGGTDDGSSNAFTSTIFHNPKDGRGFVSATSTVLPSASGAEHADNISLDLTVVKGQIYIGRVNGAYSEYSIQKIDYKSLNQAMIYQHAGQYAGTYANWVNWLIPVSNQISAMDSVYPVWISMEGL